MDLILDTTYILPLFGLRLEISKTFENELRRLWKNGLKGYKLVLSSVSLIEVIYLLNREFRNSKERKILDRYATILPSITSSKVVSIINSFQDPHIVQIANKIRASGHSDILDCYIAATAISRGGDFLSRDRELKKVIHSIEDYQQQKILDWKKIISLLA